MKLELQQIENICKQVQLDRVPVEYIQNAQVQFVNGQSARLDIPEIKKLLNRQRSTQQPIVSDINGIRLNYELIQELMETEVLKLIQPLGEEIE